MSRRTLLERYNAQLDEEIDAREAYTDKGSLRTIINRKRDVGVVELVKEFVPKLEKYNLGVIPLRMTSHHAFLAIIYRDKEKALQLYAIARSKGGYLRDDTPNEAREIGKLLGYTDESINQYIWRKYTIKLKQSDDDTEYSGLDENHIPSLKENIEIQKTIGFMKRMKLVIYFLILHWFSL